MSPDSKAEERVSLRGVLRRQIYQSSDQFYTVAVLQTHPDSREVTVAGDLGGCAMGDTVAVTGRRVEHPKFGAQIRDLTVRWIPPVTKDGTRRFLASGQVKGIGDEIAQRIVDRFGLETWKVLDETPSRLTEVEGIGKQRAEALAEAWKACRERFEETAFLAGLGLGPVLSSRVKERFGQEAAKRVKSAPYDLAMEVEGIGFHRADDVARSLGVDHDAPERLVAALTHVLKEQSEEGHTYTMRHELVRRAAELLKLPAGPLDDALVEATKADRLISEPFGEEGGEAIYGKRLHRDEVEVARELRARLELPRGDSDAVADELAWAEPRIRVTLTEAQSAALGLLLTHRVGVLTGGPGVGKTTIVRVLTEVLQRRGLEVALAAPTGRAARRLEEACEHPASTIHRLLKFHPIRRRFEHDRSNPLPCEALLVDEASMIDVPLMRSLLVALPRTAHLYVIGDADQLPSVGPGDVLRSMVESRVVPVARLTEILRQREGSTIVQAAHAVQRGECPEFQKFAGEGAFFVVRDDAYAAQKLALDVVATKLPDQFGFDPRRDVQVLTPMHKGPLGTLELNEKVKERLNPSGEGTLAPGDRVIQTRNNYDLEVFNGEIGTVSGVEIKEGKVTVKFDDREVTYNAKERADLQLAYAITVHKSQGCEFPAVVLVLSMQHHMMLRRNLVYTALTRPRRVLVVIGSERALRRSVEAGLVSHRRSRLAERLRGEIG